MSDIEKVKNELLEALLAEIPGPLDESCEVCLKMLIESARENGTNQTEWAIANMLERKVTKGELTKRWALWKGRRVLAYRKVR